MLRGIDHVVFRVRDVERALDWYRELFGLTAEGLEEWRAGDKPFVSIRVSDSFIIDLVAGEPEGTNVDHVAFTVDRADFDGFVAAHGDLIEMGPADLSGAQGTGRGLYLRDPDDHRIELRTYA